MILKTCPFCGEKPDIYVVNTKIDSTAVYIVKCTSAYCDIQPRTNGYVDKQSAINYWNRRYPKGEDD